MFSFISKYSVTDSTIQCPRYQLMRFNLFLISSLYQPLCLTHAKFGRILNPTVL